MKTASLGRKVREPTLLEYEPEKKKRRRPALRLVLMTRKPARRAKRFLRNGRGLVRLFELCLLARHEAVVRQGPGEQSLELFEAYPALLTQDRLLGDLRR